MVKSANTELFEARMTTMTITIERTPRTLMFAGKEINVEELSVELPFARKPCSLEEVGGYGNYKVLVTETKEMTPEEFDSFGRTLLKSREWLAGKGGGTGNGFLCVEIKAPGRPYLYVNPEGGDYARYVARLG
jgi:hypothetical protein